MVQSDNKCADLQTASAPVANFDGEQGDELFCGAAVSRWRHVSADLQWVARSGKNEDSTWMLGLRAGVMS